MRQVGAPKWSHNFMRHILQCHVHNRWCNIQRDIPMLVGQLLPMVHNQPQEWISFVSHRVHIVLQTANGMDPVKLFLCTWRDVKLDKWPNSEGMVPLKLAFWTCKSSRLDIPPISVPMVPSKWVLDRCRTFKFSNAPQTPEVTNPSREFEFNFTELNEVSCAISVGNAPMNPTLWRCNWFNNATFPISAFHVC